MFYASQIIGRRDCQEDSYAIEELDVIDENGTELMQVFVVADGMGGHSSGEIASRVAVDAFMRSVESGELWSPQRLPKALTEADNAIALEISQNSTLAGMGTTLLGVTRRGDELAWISVGDSLLLLFRGSELEQLNEDHSMLPVLIESAEAKGQARSVAYRDPRRHRLRSALIGIAPKLVDTGTVELCPQDILLVATDGLATLDMIELKVLLTENYGKAPESLASEIIAKMLEREALQQDNATLIVYGHV